MHPGRARQYPTPQADPLASAIQWAEHLHHTEMSDDEKRSEVQGFHPFAWPDVPRVAFDGGQDVDLDARLDWVRSEPDLGVGYYERAYEAAIEALYEKVLGGSIVVEYALFPLAFLWRHRIELLLKGVVHAGARLWCDEKVATDGHDLIKLWEKARRYSEPLGPKNAPELANAQQTLADFQRIDPGADGFRYPLGRKGTQNLGDAPDRVNLASLQRAMSAVANFLSGVQAELAGRLEYFLEQESEMAREYGPVSPESIRQMRLDYMMRVDAP